MSKIGRRLKNLWKFNISLCTWIPLVIVKTKLDIGTSLLSSRFQRYQCTSYALDNALVKRSKTANVYFKSKMHDASNKGNKCCVSRFLLNARPTFHQYIALLNPSNNVSELCKIHRSHVVDNIGRVCSENPNFTQVNVHGTNQEEANYGVVWFTYIWHLTILEPQNFCSFTVIKSSKSVYRKFCRPTDFDAQKLWKYRSGVILMLCKWKMFGRVLSLLARTSWKWQEKMEQIPPRRTLSQFLSLKIRISPNFMLFRNVVRRILKLQSCERVRRARPTDRFTIQVT